VPAVVLARPAQSQLVSCGDGKHIFVLQATSTAHWGVRAKISTDPNGLETSSCNGAVFITSHLDNCSSWCGIQVETGTRQTPNRFVYFAEKETAGGVTLDELAFVAPNDWGVVRVRGVNHDYPTVKYHMEYNELDGIGWHDAQVYTVSWGTGWPMGETEKKRNDTTMVSMHRNLQYQNSSNGQELDWLGMNCIVDEAPGWKWDPVGASDNDYNVVGGSGPC
jgi:hypothetical protein